MWVFSVEGFVSIVADRKDPRRMLVRGRSRADVENFSRRLGIAVTETPEADYPYRLFAPKKRVAKLLAELVSEVDYPNFKDEVAARQGKDREDLYHEVWGVMRHGLQTARAH